MRRSYARNLLSYVGNYIRKLPQKVTGRPITLYVGDLVLLIIFIIGVYIPYVNYKDTIQ